MFGAMGAMLLASLAVPDVFGDDAVLFTCAYAVVRIAQLVLYAVAGRGDRELLAAVARLGAGQCRRGGPLFLAATLDGKPQVTVWAIALACDLLGPYLGGGRGWHLSPGHFVERHGLIVIIALGESIVAIGVGATSNLDAGVIAAALLGFAVASCLWWAYFDVVAIVAERRLKETEGNAQLAMARDSYSYLHLPMIAGIILFAVGVKKTMGHVGDPLEIPPRSRSVAESPSTSSRTSCSGSGTCAPSVGGGSWSAWPSWRCSPRPWSYPPWRCSRSSLRSAPG